MEIESTSAPAATPRRAWLDVAIALAATAGLYVAPFAYFLSACTSVIDFEQRVEWLVFMVIVIPVTYPGYVALAAAAVFALVFVASRSARFVRIRAVAIPASIAAVVAGALVLGVAEPTSCSII